MTYTIRGYNDFYDGWVCALLLQPLPEKPHPFFREGYNMAQETGIQNAVTVLPAEIKLKHVIVEPHGFS